MPSTQDGDLKVTGYVSVGNVNNPPKVTGGSGAIDTANKANASLHLRTDADTLPELMHNSVVAKVALAGNSHECRMANLVANTANTYTTYTLRKGIITAVKCRFLVVPSSAGGTVVAGITINGVQILASASEDLEGLSADTLTSLALTATSANLKFEAGQKVVITITSNNADMVGGTEPMLFLTFDEN